MKKFFTAIGWAFLFLLMFLVVQTVVTVAVTVAVLIANPEIMSGDPLTMTKRLMEAVLVYGSQIAGVSAAILIPVILIFKPMGQTRKEGYGLRWMGFKNLFSVIALAFGLYVLINMAVALIPWPESWMELHETSTGAVTSGGFWVNLVCAALLVPFMEELLFRGAIYGSLKKGMPTVVAMILQAAFFGLMHMNPIQFCYAFVLGICLGLVYERTKSIWAVAALHMIFNGISVVLTGIGEDKANEWLSQPAVNLAILTGCAVLGILGIVGLVLFNRQPAVKRIAP